MLTYFSGMKHIFIGEMEAKTYWGDGSKSLGQNLRFGTETDRVVNAVFCRDR